MKKALYILLFVSFFIQISANLWIMAGFYLNRDYISANLCINRFDKIPVCKGSCYLEKKLTENEKQQAKWPGLKMNDLTLFCHAASSERTLVSWVPLSISYPSRNTSFIPLLLPGSIFRPPCPAVC